MDIKQEFLKIYGEGEGDVMVFFAPGRVNIIGEHTDYNGGYVLPCAINRGAYLACRMIDKPIMRMASLNFSHTQDIDLEKPLEDQSKDWVRYPMGVLREFLDLQYYAKGMECLFFGDIPNGAGLSSSASIEILMAYALNNIFKAKLPELRLVKMAQNAENLFVGLNCGIMDMFAIGMGKEKNVIFLNCESLKYNYAPFELDGFSLIVSNTNKKRGLADSKYNERVAECNQALEILGAGKKRKNLSHYTLKDFESLQHLIEDKTIRDRAFHVISENDRVIQAYISLQAGDFESLGKLMNESHASLKNSYDVTGIELDTLVESAQKQKGVLGSRMTGAGFGGCTVSLVKNENVEDFMKNVENDYLSEIGYKPTFYKVEVGGGPRKIV